MIERSRDPLHPLRRLWLVGVWAWLCCGCVPAQGRWDLSPLRDRTPALRDTAHRLDDLAPQLVHRDGELILFLCRWPTDAPIGVVFPPDATADETSLLERALAAWSGAGLGVTFERVERAAGAIEIRFVQAGDPEPLPDGAGDTLADCRIDGFGSDPDRIDARLREASIHLRRDPRDALGRPVALDPDEQLGAALHEIGHALGFSSHVAAGGSVLRTSPEIARQMGARVRRGEWTPDPNLRALYSVESGTRVGRRALTPESAGLLARFERAVLGAGMQGPFSRVGDHGARIFYRNERGVPFALRVQPWPVSGADAGSLEFVPNAPARWLLDAQAQNLR